MCQAKAAPGVPAVGLALVAVRFPRGLRPPGARSEDRLDGDRAPVRARTNVDPL